MIYPFKPKCCFKQWSPEFVKHNLNLCFLTKKIYIYNSHENITIVFFLVSALQTSLQTVCLLKSCQYEGT